MKTVWSAIAFSILLVVTSSQDARDDILQVHLEVRQNVTPPASNMLYMVRSILQRFQSFVIYPVLFR